MTIMFEGRPVLVKCISRQDDMLMHIRTDTRTDGEYIYNIYSHRLGFSNYSDGIIKFHKRLKIYHCMTYGYYVICQGKRMYVNGIVRNGG